MGFADHVARALAEREGDAPAAKQPDRRERVHPEPEVLAQLRRLGVRVYLGPDKRLLLRRPGVMTISDMETAEALVRERADEIRAALER